MGQPSDGIGLAGTGAVLDQIILGSAVLPDVSQHTADHIQLMVARENQIFRTLHLAGLVIDFFFYLHKDKLADEVKHGVLGQNILPHIGDTVSVLKGRIACTGGHTLAVAHVEGQEEGGISCQLGGHVDLLQVHREVHQAARLEQEQTCLRVTLGAVLVDGILVGLTCGVAFQLKGDDGKTVQENDHIDALFIAGPDFLHNGEDVLAIFLCQLRIEGGGGLSVHQIELPVGYLNAVLQHIDQAASGFGSLCVDEADDGILQIVFVDFPQIVHRVRLGVSQELHEHLPIHSKKAVKVGGLANDIPVGCQPLQQIFLIVLFRENICH